MPPLPAQCQSHVECRVHCSRRFRLFLPSRVSPSRFVYFVRLSVLTVGERGKQLRLGHKHYKSRFFFFLSRR